MGRTRNAKNAARAARFQARQAQRVDRAALHCMRDDYLSSISEEESAAILGERSEGAARTIRYMKGKHTPYNMTWVETSMFLKVCAISGAGGDVKKCLWAYTSALITTLENLLTDAQAIVGSDNPLDAYKYIVPKLQIAITKHLQLLDKLNGETVIEVPPPDDLAWKLLEAVHTKKRKIDGTPEQDTDADLPSRTLDRD